MPSSTVENYLKQLCLEEQQSPGGLVPMGRLAQIMGVVPGTATAMVKALADSGLVIYEPRGGVRLSEGGRKLALHVIRRHRLVELFLVQTLGLDWSEVHIEAEQLEHAISDKVLERIDAHLGHPATDPHGDPIPTAKGQVAQVPQHSLLDCPPRQPQRVVRVIDQNPHFLQFVDRGGLTPGTLVSVQRRDAQADAVTLRIAGREELTVGNAAAGKILVEPA